ncbi:replication initiator protein [Blackfly microvirus SF02]|uniref:Replication initiator protein n=1 Tax=Blackfly microvirus SF02 TaxID=2576452 RepID=A0A4P8PU01_9VIRU|nr:replication initiator protein [Blackfly microvirus SF02]
MTCFYPVSGFRGPTGGLVMVKSKSPSQIPLTVPCGRCIGCRMTRSRQWAARIGHEASLHEENSFVTLTYNDRNLPDDYSVSVRALQLFLKRLRKKIEPRRVRFYACGEYGEKTLRPHYHIILFGYQFPDLVVWRRSPTGFYLYRSEILEELWQQKGHCEIGQVTASSGGYVARYCLKKIGGAPAADHYTRLHPLTGEICHVHPEFATQSTRPGIGSTWFDKYERDAFPSDFLVVEGQKVPVPSYYTRKLKDRYEYDLSEERAFIPRDDLGPIQRKRKDYAKSNASENTPERLAIRRECAEIRSERLTRELDD